MNKRDKNIKVYNPVKERELFADTLLAYVARVSQGDRKATNEEMNALPKIAALLENIYVGEEFVNSLLNYVVRVSVGEAQATSEEMNALPEIARILKGRLFADWA